MATHHQPHDHHGNPTLPCASCSKRHARPDSTVRRRRETIGISVGPSRRAIAFIASLALAAMAMSHGSVPAVAVAAALPIEAKGISLRSSFAKLAEVKANTRRLQAATEEEDHADGDEDEEHVDEVHEDEDHGDEEHGDEEHEDEEHEDEEHGDEEHEDEEHEDEEHGDEEHEDEEHEDEEHGDEEHEDHGDEDEESHLLDEGDTHDDHDDHSGHDDHDDHGEEAFDSFSSANENVEEKLPWGQVIGATLLVNLASLSGCLIIALTALHRGLLQRKGENPSDSAVGHGKLFDICIPAFAAGALIATAVFLIFPEALHLIEGGHKAEAEEGDAHDDHSGHRYLQEDSHAGHDDSSESTNAAKFGCAILGGFLLPFLFSIFFHHTEPDDTADVLSKTDALSETGTVGDDVQTGVPMKAKESDSGDLIRKIEEVAPQDKHPCDLCEEGEHVSEQESVPLVTKTIINKQLCASILLGDAFHNFSDGVFIAAAFKSCSSATAISIILVTLFHELAQELADFVLLTRYAGLSSTKALALNFISGLSVCLGGIVFLAGNPSDETTGVILAIAGGVYFNIAACETIPRIEKAVEGRGDRVWTLFSIILGTVPIGLILLNHKHCE